MLWLANNPMMYYFIEGVDRAGDVAAGTLNTTQQLQQRSDTTTFEVFKGAQPTVNSDVKIYDGDTVASASGAVIVLKGQFEQSDPDHLGSDNNQIYNMWYPGQEIWLRPQTTTSERAVVLSYNKATMTLTLETAPVVGLSPGDVVAWTLFSGFISQVKDKNLQLLQNLVWDVTCSDYSKLFGAKIVTGSWLNVDARYIINDFCNNFVNYNQTLDELYYANNTALQAIWSAHTGDATAPTVDGSLFIEGLGSSVFAWTHSGGTATWTATLSNPLDLSLFTGVASGQPQQGYAMFWYDTATGGNITSFTLKIGSDSSHYIQVPFKITTTSAFAYASGVLNVATIVGIPNWTAVNFVQIVVVETGSGSIHLNGLRVNADSAFTLYQVEPTSIVPEYRSAQIQASDLINRLAKSFGFAWYISYDSPGAGGNGDVFFGDIETAPAPFQITDTSNNFNDLQIQTDVSNVGNRIIINGGNALSLNTFTQVFTADGSTTMYALAGSPGSMAVAIDDGSSTLTSTTGTNTTTVVFSAPHGLVSGNYLVNTTRTLVRQVLTVPNSLTLTVFAVPSQTSGDVFSFFSVPKTSGQSGVVDPSTVDYVYDPINNSVSTGTNTAPLAIGKWIAFTYTALTPIILEYADGASVNALKAMGFGDGFFDLSPYSDQNITDANTALMTAQAQVGQYANAIITGTFTTDWKGLRAGQILTVQQYISRNFSGDYLIQKLQVKHKSPNGAGRYKDYLSFVITFSTTLFGWVELMQKALRSSNEIGLDTLSNQITLIAASVEIPTAHDDNIVQNQGDINVPNTETPTAAATNTATLFSPPWVWGTFKWGLSEWS